MPTENLTEKAWVMNRTTGGQRCVFVADGSRRSLILFRKRMNFCTGTAHSRQLGPEIS